MTTQGQTVTMSNEITVRHLDGDRFGIDIRGHRINVDQPTEAGNQDTAPTPTELFIAALASCVAFYARRYLARHEISTAGFAVTTVYTMASRPNRVSEIDIQITPPTALPVERRDAFLAVASHCTVHNTLEKAPVVEISLASKGPS
jgi:putative redox protein